MSFWINTYKCNKCGHEIGVSGGVVGTNWIGPNPKFVTCYSDKCDNEGLDNFTCLDCPNFEVAQQ